MSVNDIAYSGTELQLGPGRHVLALSRPIDWPLGSRILIKSITRVDTAMTGSLVEAQDAEMRIAIEADPDTGVRVDSSEAWNVLRIADPPKRDEVPPEVDAALMLSQGWKREDLEHLCDVDPRIQWTDNFETSLPPNADREAESSTEAAKP